MDNAFQKVSPREDEPPTREREDCCDADMGPAAEPAPPEWKVYFDGNFRGHYGKDRAGTEIPLGAEFTWAGHRWVVPAAYACGKGLVVDFCMRAEPEAIHGFMEKWGLYRENAPLQSLTGEQRRQMEAENPLGLRFLPRLEMSRKTLQVSHGCSVYFYPCAPEEEINSPNAKWAVDHYGLDPAYGWVITRNVFPWKRRPPKLSALRVVMAQQPVRVPGPHFITHQPGDTFTMAHPVSGAEYRLTVRELERQTIPEGSFGSGRWSYPTHTVAMTYTLSPDPEEDIVILDCAESDEPVETAPRDPMAPTATAGVAVLGIIGGADGPAAISVVGRPTGKLRAAYSSLHFSPAETDVEWRIEFTVKRFEEASFELI